MFRVLYYVVICFAIISSHLSLFTIEASANGVSSELKFVAHTAKQEQRTSLDLTPVKPLRFSDNGFTMEFDIKLRREEFSFGYIFRVISEDQTSFDMLSSIGPAKFNFVLINSDKVLENVEYIDSKVVKENYWFHIKVKFEKERIVVDYGDHQSILERSFKNFKDIKIYFGINHHPVFYVTDLAPISMKNIKLYDGNDKLVRDWDLSRHSLSYTYDVVKGDKAVVNSGIWSIDDHNKWEKKDSLTIKEINPQIAFDRENKVLFIVQQNIILKYNLTTSRSDTIHTTKGYPYIGVSSQVVYDAKRDRLVSYCPEFEDINTFDFGTKEWTESKPRRIDYRQQHNRIWSEEGDELVVFGGFGTQRYNSELVKYDFIQDKWSYSSFDSIIAPRYLSAIGRVDRDNILILGGYGNPSGKQEESPRNYYDLYKINTENNKCQKLWSYSNIAAPYAFSNSMIVDSVSNTIYALTYNNKKYYSEIYLSAFDITPDGDPKQRIMSDTIPYNFVDIRSYCDLLLDKESSTIYAVLIYEKVPNVSLINIYTLAYPPLSREHLVSTGAKMDWEAIKITLFLSIAVALACVVWLYVYRKWNKKEPGNIDTRLLLDGYNSTSEGMEYDNRFKPKTSVISLLGGCQIFDRQGSDITDSFTPTIKQILIYLLLYSIREEKGISSMRLEETFWMNMDKAKASNNRRVNISRLRLLLDEIGDITLSNKNDYWYLKIGDEVVCDYKQITEQLNKLGEDHLFSIDEIDQLTYIALSGALVPNMSADWLDDYKSEYSCRIIEVLLKIASQLDVQKHPRLMLKVADAILMQDTIEEEAIKIKCRTLYMLKHKGTSKQAYKNFYEEYKRLLGEEPNLTYNDIITP